MWPRRREKGWCFALNLVSHHLPLALISTTDAGAPVPVPALGAQTAPRCWNAAPAEKRHRKMENLSYLFIFKIIPGISFAPSAQGPVGESKYFSLICYFLSRADEMIWYPERGSLWAPPSGVQRGHSEEEKHTGAENLTLPAHHDRKMHKNTHKELFRVVQYFQSYNSFSSCIRPSSALERQSWLTCYCS